MFENFLAHSHTDALFDKDFQEWHHGIPYYGFWAILIEDKNSLGQVSNAQKQLQHFFLPGYSRQAHITLNAGGLMSEAYFSKTKLAQQISLIQSIGLSPFEISLGHIDSFTTAAYISVIDSSNTLLKINEALSFIASDAKPDMFQPHVTLGLYRDRFESTEIAKEVMKLEDIKTSAFEISEIQFCRYETKNIQGPIEVIQRFKL